MKIKNAVFVTSVANKSKYLKTDKPLIAVCGKSNVGKSSLINEVLYPVTANALNGVDYDGRCIICHSNCLVEANRLIGMIEGRFENLKGKIDLYPIGPTIGSHSGPGTIALFYFGNERGE